MKVRMNFNAVIASWLDKDPEDRDLEQGAMLLLQLDRNNIAYNARMRNLKAHAAEMEDALRGHLTRRENTPTPEEAEQIRKDAGQLLESLDKSADSKSEAKAFKTGKRPDHDSLPDEIRQVYDENIELRQKMSQYHLEIRTLLRKKTACASTDLKELCKLLKSTDLKYHDNWKKYDSYGKQ